MLLPINHYFFVGLIKNRSLINKVLINSKKARKKNIPFRLKNEKGIYKLN